MRLKLMALLCFAFVTGALPAQKKLSSAIGVQAGLLEGEAGGSFQLKALGGIRRETWTLAAGAGLDYYYLRSVPIFLHLQKDFGRRKTPFVYAEGGYNFPWLKQDQKVWNNMGETTGGFYGDAGIGYRLPVKSSALEFSLGYSVKNLTTTNTNWAVIDIWPPPPMVFIKQEHTLRRVSVKAGLWF